MSLKNRILNKMIQKSDRAGFLLKEKSEDRARFYHTNKNMVVIFSVSLERDGKEWIHLSASLADRVPTYYELCDLKKLFIGDEYKALMVFPPKSEHVNLHPYCLHLWCCVDSDPLPDFRKIPGMI